MKPKRKYRLRKYYDGGVNDNELVQTIPQTTSSPYMQQQYQWSPNDVHATQQNTNYSVQGTDSYSNIDYSQSVNDTGFNTITPEQNKAYDTTLNAAKKIPVIGGWVGAYQATTQVADMVANKDKYGKENAPNTVGAYAIDPSRGTRELLFNKDFRNNLTTGGKAAALLTGGYSVGLQRQNYANKLKNDALAEEQRLKDEQFKIYQQSAQDLINQQDLDNNLNNKYDVRYNQNLAYAAKGGKIRNSRMMSRRESEKAMPMFYDKNYFLKYFHSIKSKYPYGGMIDDNMIQQQVQQGMPNAEVEANEGVQMPNGQSMMVDGRTHAQGGEPMALPNETKIYSNRISPSKEFLQRLKEKGITI